MGRAFGSLQQWVAAPDLAAQRFRDKDYGFDFIRRRTTASVDPMQRAEYIKDV
jgi:hypothetical protein